MKKWFYTPILALLFSFHTNIYSQVDPDEMGAWYLYIINTRFKKDSLWGVQGDIQHRNFNIIGDLQQLLIRGGITYMPKESPLKLTFGYAHITNGAPGASTESSVENRFYQETSFPIKLARRIYSNHRFRYEMRYMENQDFRTRYRYGVFLNIPLKKIVMEPKTLYLSFYNEIFINGQRKIGEGKNVPFFDLNRLYGAFGYVFRKGLKMQFGMMRQTTNSFGKYQLQLSLHHTL